MISWREKNQQCRVGNVRWLAVAFEAKAEGFVGFFMSQNLEREFFWKKWLEKS